MEFLRNWFGGKIKIVLLAILLLAISACGVSAGMEFWKEWRTPPEQVVGEALMRATEAPSYSYASQASRIDDGQAQVISQVQGQKNGENIHLFGTVDVVDSQVDVYQIGDTFYRQDVVSGNWLKMQGHDEEATERLLQEIDPLGCLMYNATAEVTYLDKEKVNGVKCRKYQVRATGENTFLTSVWNEYYYTVWIDKNRQLQQVEVIAGDHENRSDQLKLEVQFDWATPVDEITAPVS